MTNTCSNCGVDAVFFRCSRTTGFAQPRTVAASQTASICGSAVHHSPSDSICSGGFQPPGHVEQPTSLASTTPDWRFMPIALAWQCQRGSRLDPFREWFQLVKQLLCGLGVAVVCRLSTSCSRHPLHSILLRPVLTLRPVLVLRLVLVSRLVRVLRQVCML